MKPEPNPNHSIKLTPKVVKLALEIGQVKKTITQLRAKERSINDELGGYTVNFRSGEYYVLRQLSHYYQMEGRVSSLLTHIYLGRKLSKPLMEFVKRLYEGVPFEEAQNSLKNQYKLVWDLLNERYENSREYRNAVERRNSLTSQYLEKVLELANKALVSISKESERPEKPEKTERSSGLSGTGSQVPPQSIYDVVLEGNYEI